MFFIGLTFSIILIGVGIVFLVEAAYVLGGILLGIGILSLLSLGVYYSSKRNKKLDCDCMDCSFFTAYTDCDCIGKRKGLDCDCDLCNIN